MKKIFTFIAALTLSMGLWAANSVITFTSTSKLYPGDPNELMMDVAVGDGAKWAAFKAQYPEFADVMNPAQLEMMGISLFNPNAFLDANNQVLNYTYNYDESTHAGTITFAGELVTLYGSNYDGVAAFRGCSSLTSIILPEGLTSLGHGSFVFCSSLASATLPESLIKISGATIFGGCSSLASISIPANVTEIGNGAFMDCSGLTDFYVAWTTMLPTLGNIVFGDASIGTATLHVPAGSLALYQTADQWKNFGTIVEYDPLADIKTAAIAAVNAAIAEGDNDNVKAIAANAATAINAATSVEVIDALKAQAIANIASAKAAYTAGYNSGLEEGKATGIEEGKAAGKAEMKAELLGNMGEECTDCTAVEVTNGTTTVILYKPTNVGYIKITE